MISSLRGTLEAIGPDWIALAVGGVSLKVHVPSSTIETLGPVGTKVRLFTHLQVREDALNLYGFSSNEARSMFEVFLGIRGVGPRLALKLLSFFTPESLAATIASGDIDALSRIPGLGKKTASRIVLELKGKLDEWALLSGAPADDETAAALIALGYGLAEVRDAISGLPSDGDTPLEERIRLALQRLASG